MLYGLTDSQTLKDSATQFLTEYKGGALVTQLWQEKKKREESRMGRKKGKKFLRLYKRTNGSTEGRTGGILGPK